MTSGNETPEIVEIVNDEYMLGSGNSDTEITIEYIPTKHDDSIPYFAGQDLIQWYSTIEEAKHAIELYQISTHTKFIKLNNHKYGEDLTKSRIRWDSVTRVPYIMLRSLNLECQHAKDRNKESNEMRRKRSVGPYQVNGEQKERKRYHCNKGSKKGNCKATINIIEVLRFPQYRTDDLAKPSRTTTSRLIRKSLQKGDHAVYKEFMVRVMFPPLEAHSGHNFGEVTEAQKYILQISELASDIKKVSTVVTSTDLLREVCGNLARIMERLNTECDTTGCTELAEFVKKYPVNQSSGSSSAKRVKKQIEILSESDENLNMQMKDTLYMLQDRKATIVVTTDQEVENQQLQT
uniref:Uncharacterized protein LOC104265996 n=1 Tax=Phallusia mammillata TaxID=59560 RepID=A0A6F9DJM9_9ASCI|nr:uncharacterized protein LOC104265996 [Phallusia mammillata]